MNTFSEADDAQNRKNKPGSSHDHHSPGEAGVSNPADRRQTWMTDVHGTKHDGARSLGASPVPGKDGVTPGSSNSELSESVRKAVRAAREDVVEGLTRELLHQSGSGRMPKEADMCFHNVPVEPDLNLRPQDGEDPAHQRPLVPPSDPINSPPPGPAPLRTPFRPADPRPPVKKSS